MAACRAAPGGCCAALLHRRRGRRRQRPSAARALLPKAARAWAAPWPHRVRGRSAPPSCTRKTRSAALAAWTSCRARRSCRPGRAGAAVRCVCASAKKEGATRRGHRAGFGACCMPIRHPRCHVHEHGQCRRWRACVGKARVGQGPLTKSRRAAAPRARAKGLQRPRLLPPANAARPLLLPSAPARPGPRLHCGA